MTDMIQAEPGFAWRLLGRLAAADGPAARLAAVVRRTAIAGQPIQVVGCGTSEHGALAVAEILRDALRATGSPGLAGAGGTPVAVQAFEASLDAMPGAGSVTIGVSHEGATAATNRALDLARAAGSTTALITVSAASPGAALAEYVVTTDELDTSWCHTVGYLSPIVAAAAVGSHVSGAPIDRERVMHLLGDGLDADAVTATTALARALAGVDRVIVVGSGADRIAARELTLKIEEGTHLPAAMRDLETFLHGHLAGTDAETGLVVILADPSARGQRTARALSVLRACREIGVVAGAILADVVAGEIDPELTPAGRVIVADGPELPGPVAALLATAIPLQLLTERLAVARGVDPDPIRRDDPRYLAAADAAG